MTRTVTIREHLSAPGSSREKAAMTLLRLYADEWTFDDDIVTGRYDNGNTRGFVATVHAHKEMTL